MLCARGVGLTALVVLCLTLGLSVSPSSAAPYFNSTEAGCDGSDPNVLICENWELNGAGGTPGTWFVVDGDTSTGLGFGGYGHPGNKGWGGNITSPPANGAARCGAGVTPFGNCAGFGGVHTGSVGGVWMAQHQFKVGACGTDGNQTCGVDEIYIRWYSKWDTGYTWAQEKHMNPTKAAGGIFWSNLTLCNGSGTPLNTSCAIHFNIAATSWSGGLDTSTNIVPNRWYFMEQYLKLNTPGVANGLGKLWLNDCGPTGTTCGATPTLQVTITNILFANRGSASDLIEMVWLENWANSGNIGPPVTCSGQEPLCGSRGSGPSWDQLKVSRVGPIGFSGAPSGSTNTDRTTVVGAVALSGTTPGRSLGTVLAPRSTIRSVGLLPGLLLPVGFFALLMAVRARARRASEPGGAVGLVR